MAIASRKEALLLFLGDTFIFLAALFLALFLRRFEVPSRELFYSHLLPFTFLWAFGVAVFFIAGLYEKHTLILRSKLPSILFNAQVANALFAIVFFYFAPRIGIEPKTNLFIYLLVSTGLLFLWRVYGIVLLPAPTKERALIIGSGEEVREMKDEINHNPRYNLIFVSSIDLDRVREVDFKEEIVKRVYAEGIGVIVVDFDNKSIESVLSHLYNLMFSHVRFIDMHKVYEDLFDRMPLSLLKHGWFLENITLTPQITYAALKRTGDFIAALLLGMVSLVFYPLVYIAIKLDDGGPLFFKQERVGKNKQPIHILKFRTMRVKEDVDVLKDDAMRVTRVGKVLRATRIDELPQLWNVLKGDLSLIGPRPELPELVKQYEAQIPYYDVRHLVTPGLSGWAQIYHERHPHHGLAHEETKEKLSYDLYYIKNHSLLLDLKIALKTIKTLLSRMGA
jgi:exopolysaccharide biosynthesis polyprenyl glycosylphosphotransferase